MPFLSRKVILSVSVAVIAVAALTTVGLQRYKPLEPVTVTEHQQIWATPVDKGFNLYQMTPNLYRSALPTADNVPMLQALNVGTVVTFIKDNDKTWMGNAQMSRVSIPLHADRVTDADVIRVLHVLQDAGEKGPVLMHCKHGRDRTGLMAAMYRMVIQGWSKTEAISEMRTGGFGDPERMADALAYVQNADVEAIKQAYNSGKCSTSPLSTCYAKNWLTSVFSLAKVDD